MTCNMQSKIIYDNSATATKTVDAVQTLTASGQVFDMNMKILPNVNVTVVGEAGSDITDTDGSFIVPINSTASVLHFSAVGYDYDEISAEEFKNLGYIQLGTHTEVLNETPVAGSKKSSNTLLYIGLGILAVLGIYKVSKSNTKKVTIK